MGVLTDNEYKIILENLSKKLIMLRTTGTKKIKPKTQFELAKIIGVTQSAISNWERGVAPNLQGLCSYQRIYKFSMDSLLTPTEIITGTITFVNDFQFLTTKQFELFKEIHKLDDVSVIKILDIVKKFNAMGK